MSFFFFQAEDGIRDADVTGVQTCALPISSRSAAARSAARSAGRTTQREPPRVTTVTQRGPGAGLAGRATTTVPGSRKAAGAPRTWRQASLTRSRLASSISWNPTAARAPAVRRSAGPGGTLCRLRAGKVVAGHGGRQAYRGAARSGAESPGAV